MFVLGGTERQGRGISGDELTGCVCEGMATAPDMPAVAHPSAYISNITDPSSNLLCSATGPSLSCAASDAVPCSIERADEQLASQAEER